MKRNAFTLTELLVVIAVIGILSSTMVFALYGAMERAKISTANTEIEAINERIMAMWDAHRTRPIRLNTPTGDSVQETEFWIGMGKTPPTTTEQAYRNMRHDGKLVAVSRLNALRDIQRMELPDRITDVADGPMRTPTSPVIVPYATAMGTLPLMTSKSPISGRYWRFADSHAHATGDPTATGIEFWSERFEGAECLWMILKFNSQDDPLRCVQSENSIDKDGDGMPEVADPWGNPVEWLRWAPGYDGITPMVKDPIASPDPFNPLRIQQTAASGTPRDYMLIPLIYSAGPDGEYEINKIKGLAYRSLTVPCDPFFDPTPDPQVGTMVGMGSIDNITNHYIATR